MRITIVVIGRIKAGPERELYERYVKRISWPIALKEIDDRAKLTVPERRRREARSILDACPEGAILCVLDGRGAAITSEALAYKLGDWRDQGVGDLAFVIGGDGGLDDSVLRRAEIVLSFGAMTWPHMLARAMLAEQLYRAQQILAHHPYHRG